MNISSFSRNSPDRWRPSAAPTCRRSVKNPRPDSDWTANRNTGGSLLVDWLIELSLAAKVLEMESTVCPSALGHGLGWVHYISTDIDQDASVPPGFQKRQALKVGTEHLL